MLVTYGSPCSLCCGGKHLCSGRAIPITLWLSCHSHDSDNSPTTSRDIHCDPDHLRGAHIVHPPAMPRVGAASTACYVLLRKGEASSVPPRVRLRQRPCLMARRLPKPSRDAKPRSDCEVIVWRTGMDKLSGSWAVCHQLASFRNVPLRHKSATMEIWHRFCSLCEYKPPAPT